MKEESITVTINNWERFQPRKDRANHTWFRVDNSIMFSEAIDGLSADQKWFWICLLGYASRKSSGSVEYNCAYFEKHFGVSKKKMDEALRHLEQNGTITIEQCAPLTPTGVRLSPVATIMNPEKKLCLTTDRQTDITDKQTDSVFDFEIPYEEYPKRPGQQKGAAFERLAKQIRSKFDYDDFCRAVLNYRDLCVRNKVEAQYIKQFFNFVGSNEKQPWREFVELDETNQSLNWDLVFGKKVVDDRG